MRRQESVVRGEVAHKPATFAPYSIAYLLAGYLTPDTVDRYFPAFASLPLPPRGEVEALFGAAAKLPARGDVPTPGLGRIGDREILELIQQVAGNSLPNLSSLSGWEWVEIETLVAGHLFSGPLAEVVQRLRPSPSDIEVARYSLLSFGHAPPKLHLDVGGGVLLGDAQLTVVPGPPQIEQGGVLTVRYRIQPLFTPIRVAVLRRRAIAIQGLERLALLARRGIRRALALVHYGYGLEMMQFPPSLSDDVLFGAAPPLVRDFADSALCVAVPTPAILSVTRFMTDTLSVGSA